MKLSSRDQMILAGFIIGIVAVAFVFVFIVPQFTALSQLDQDMAKADSDMASAQALLSQRQQAKAAAAETQARLTHLDNEMPDAPELAALIIDLQDTANDAGVTWDQLNPSKPAVVPDGYQRMTITFSVRGQWDDIVDYTRRLSELERAIRVTSVDFLPSAPDPGASSTATSTGSAPKAPGKLVATFNIEAYSLPRDAKPAGAAAPGAPQ